MRLIDADALEDYIESDESCLCAAREFQRDYIECIDHMPTIDPIEYLNSKGFGVTNQVWLDSKPCYTCKENNGYCISCTKVEVWKSKNPLIL